MNTTLIDREDALKIQSDDLQNEYEQSQHRIDADDLISIENEYLSWDEWIDWWYERYESLTEEQRIEAIQQSAVWLKTNTNKYWQSDYGYCWYLNLIDSYGSELQKQETIKQTITWLRANKDELNKVRFRYLTLVDKYGSWQDRVKAIDRTTAWLEKQRDNSNIGNVWVAYLTLIDRCGTSRQRQKSIEQIANWLTVHSEDVHLWQKYLTLIEKYGDRQKRQRAIDKTATWLKAHPNDSMVRNKYIKVIYKKGTLEQKKKVISEIGTWLETYPHHSEVYRQYLVILEKYGTPQQKQEAINKTTVWLENHPEYEETRKQYLCLLRKCGDEIINLDSIIRQQWEWIKQQSKINHQLWTVFLPLLHKYAKQHSDIIPAVANLALKQNSNSPLITCMVFGNFRDYLDYDSCYELADLISQKRLPMNLWLNIVQAANFFRHYGELEKAEAIYRSILTSIIPDYKSYQTAKEIHSKIAQVVSFKAKQYQTTSQLIFKLLNNIYLNYGFLLLSGETPDLERAIEYTKVALEDNPQNSLAHWQMTKCYWLKGANFYDKVTESFQSAIKFEREGTGRISSDFGHFYRTALGESTKARKYLEKSLEQKITLPACIELAELEIEDGNFERAEQLLEQALAIIPVTRPEKEQWEELEPRLQLVLDSF